MDYSGFFTVGNILLILVIVVGFFVVMGFARRRH